MVTMWGKLCLATIGWTILSVVEVGAQSTVDESASCESSTFDEAVNIIREDLKNLLRSSNHQHSPTTGPTNSKQVLVSSLSCAY